MTDKQQPNGTNLMIQINGMDDARESDAQRHFASRVHAFVTQAGIAGLYNTNAMARIAQECFPHTPMSMTFGRDRNGLILTLDALLQKNKIAKPVRPAGMTESQWLVETQAKELEEKNQQIKGMAARIKKQKAEIRKFNHESCQKREAEPVEATSDSELSTIFGQLFGNHIHPGVLVPSGDPTGQLQVKQVREARREDEQRRFNELSDELLNTQHQLKNALETIKTEREKRYARADLKILNPFALRTQKIKQLINTIQNELTNGSYSITYFQHHSGMEASILRIAEQFEKAGYKVTVSDPNANTNRTMKIELPIEAASASLAGLVGAAV